MSRAVGGSVSLHYGAGGRAESVHSSERLFHLVCQQNAARHRRQKAIAAFASAPSRPTDTNAVRQTCTRCRRAATARLLRQSTPIRVTIVCITLIENKTRRRVQYRDLLRIYFPAAASSYFPPEYDTVRALRRLFWRINDRTVCVLPTEGRDWPFLCPDLTARGMWQRMLYISTRHRGFYPHYEYGCCCCSCCCSRLTIRSYDAAGLSVQ